VEIADYIRSDGLYAPVGVLPYDADEDRVQCHLCGGWFRALAPVHLQRHDTTADEYRALVGLNPRLPLTVPSTSPLRARQLHERIATDKRVHHGFHEAIVDHQPSGHVLELARTGQMRASEFRYACSS
jgi:hypothetical protein